MSVIMEFAIFPTDKGVHVSQYVKQVIEMIDNLPYQSQLTPMGTIIECETMEQCLTIIADANAILEPNAARVYCTAKFDNKVGKSNQMDYKIKAIRGK
ncbi:MAG: MTH1187 family thiamine-binding protein [Bacteroidales bacterium]|nr:MTH1187 family thiamine-binding protein [Bacteroidales bacterium]